MSTVLDSSGMHSDRETLTTKSPSPARINRRKKIRVLLAAASLGIVLSLMLLPRLQPILSMNDFVAYWSAGRQLVHGRNPYDSDAVLQIQREFDITRRSPLIMRNPPWGCRWSRLWGSYNFQSHSCCGCSWERLLFWFRYIACGASTCRTHLLGRLES